MDYQTPANVPGQAGQDFKQPGLVKDICAHGRGIGIR